MMNVQWKNGKELTRPNARRCGGEGNNPVRDYSLVKKRSTPTSPRMPSGMRPAFDKQGCIPTECPVLWVNTIFYSAINVSSLTAIKTTEYVGNMIYENGALKRILVDGGYFESGTYYFYVTDHQGNNRSVVSSSANWVQGNHYYPFGATFAETAVADQSKQPYRYNGKELDMMSGLNQYDYSARYYDPAIARFTTMDPLCEKYYPISPYAYCANNPVNAVDLDGRDIIFVIRNSSGKTTNQLTYRNGNFWYGNGNKYDSSKGSISSTLDRTLAAYQKIEGSGDKVLMNQLSTLEKSSNIHYVTEGKGNNVRPFESGKKYAELHKMRLEGKPVGTVTNLDFSDEGKSNFKKSTGVESTDFTTVTHEIQHQYDYDQGNMSDSNDDDEGAKDPSEIRAVKNENRARKIESLPSSRTKYGEEIIDPNKLK